MALKEQAEERLGVKLPSDAARLLQLFSSPGAVSALKACADKDVRDAEFMEIGPFRPQPSQRA